MKKISDTFFAIDPSIRACGWAILEKKKLRAGIFRSKIKNVTLATREIYEQLQGIQPFWVDHLIVERPIIQENWTQNKIKALEKLLVCYGTCLTLSEKHSEIWTPSVPQWKGQQPKDVSHRIALRVLNKNKIKINFQDKIPESLIHNALDAIALLTKYLTRKGYIEQ